MRIIPDLILASKSPRRQALLKQIGIDRFRVLPSETEEKPDENSPSEYVLTLSRQKAENVSKNADSDDIIISADTVVSIDGVILEKPENRVDAFKMLTMLSNNRHEVYTGVTVRRGDRVESFFEVTDVYFREIDSEEIEEYIASGEPFDKAGGYGIQGIGARFVSRIEGDYSNVVGLPVSRLCLLLKEFGFEL